MSTSSVALATAALCCGLQLFASPSAAQVLGDGPRNYLLVPDGTRSLTVYGIFAHGNRSADGSTVIEGGEVDTRLAVLQYTQAVAIGGSQLQLFGSLPFGDVKATVRLPSQTLSARNSGLGDAQVGALLGLIGAPALASDPYSTYRPGFTLGALGKITGPTGEYDSTKVVNIGANRWAFQLGTTVAQYIGESFLDRSLTSFELLPSVTFFTNNNDPHNANTIKQDPLWKLEGHATHNLSSVLWVSADMVYARGGETITDGVRDGNAQRSLSVGGTAGFAWSGSVFLALTYGRAVSHSEPGESIRGFRAEASVAF